MEEGAEQREKRRGLVRFVTSASTAQTKTPSVSQPSNIFDEADPIMKANASMMDESERKRAKGSNPSWLKL